MGHIKTWGLQFGDWAQRIVAVIFLQFYQYDTSRLIKTSRSLLSPDPKPPEFVYLYLCLCVGRCLTPLRQHQLCNELMIDVLAVTPSCKSTSRDQFKKRFLQDSVYFCICARVFVHLSVNQKLCQFKLCLDCAIVFSLEKDVFLIIYTNQTGVIQNVLLYGAMRQRKKAHVFTIIQCQDMTEAHRSHCVKRNRPLV